MTRQKMRPDVLEMDRLRKRQQTEMNGISAEDFDSVIPKAKFQRLIREILSQQEDKYRITAAATNALQEASELYLEFLLHDANLISKYRGENAPLHPSDIRAVLSYRGK